MRSRMVPRYYPEMQFIRETGEVYCWTDSLEDGVLMSTLVEIIDPRRNVS